MTTKNEPPADDLVARLRQQALDNVPDCGYVAHMLETKAADELEQLQVEIVKWRGHCLQADQNAADQVMRAESAERALAEAQLDAERYRWLRDTYVFQGVEASNAWNAFICADGDSQRTNKEIDAAIDAAIAAAIAEGKQT